MTLTPEQQQAVETLDRVIMAKVTSAYNGYTVEISHETALELRALIAELIDELSPP